MIWLTGGALAICAAMVAGLLLLVLWKGLSTFWPQPVARLDAIAGPFMGEITWEAEDALWRRILQEVNVNLTPGSACRIGEPGFMRLCYASEATDAVVAGLRRVGSALAGTP